MKKIKILLVGLVLLAILFTFSGCNSKAADYRSDLQDVADEILDNASEVEKILDKYASIWSFSIKNRSPIPIKEMAAHTGFDHDIVEEVFEINAAGNVPNDFSTNIHSMKAHYESNGGYVLSIAIT